MTVTGMACCIVYTCESGSGKKEEVFGLGESVTEKEDESLPQKHRGGEVVVCLSVESCVFLPHPRSQLCV